MFPLVHSQLARFYWTKSKGKHLILKDSRFRLAVEQAVPVDPCILYFVLIPFNNPSSNSSIECIMAVSAKFIRFRLIACNIFPTVYYIYVQVFFTNIKLGKRNYFPAPRSWKLLSPFSRLMFKYKYFLRHFPQLKRRKKLMNFQCLEIYMLYTFINATGRATLGKGIFTRWCSRKYVGWS